jgi:protocatechuate 3,4-dioxygenase beta subunit
VKGASFFLFAAYLSAQQASLEGVAVNTVTGQPLSGVHVRILTGNFDSNNVVYGAMSDRDGHFSIAGIRAGSYVLLPERTGFVAMSNTAGIPFPTVTLKAGQSIADFKLEMSPRAVIVGRVVDEFGDPVAGVSVESSPVDKSAPVAFTMMGENSRTDDRGEFRLVTGPGKFYVKAAPPDQSNHVNEIRTDGSSQALYGPTYYPSAAAVDRAEFVTATAGHDVTGIEIHLLHQRSVTISGVVSGIPAGVMHTSVTARFGEGVDRMYQSRNADAGPDGKFSFAAVPPGFYHVFASVNTGNTTLRSTAEEFHVESTDPPAVGGAGVPPGELAGKLEIVGEPAGTALPEKLTVRLQPVGTSMYDSGPQEAPVGADGVFQIASLFPGKYRLRVQSLPENAYIKTVQLAGAPSADDIVDLSRGASGGELKVAISRDGAQLSGMILDDDGSPLQGPVAMVVLVEESQVEKLDVSQLTGDTIARASDGKYSFKGVRPGTYRILAFDAFRSRDMQDAAGMKKALATAGKLEIKERDRIAKDVKVTPPEQSNAKPKP